MSVRSFLAEINDIQQLLRLIDPHSFAIEHDSHFDEGLLQMRLDEPVKLQMCYILQHLCNYQLQYRIEAIIAFSEEFVGRLQSVSIGGERSLASEHLAFVGSKAAIQRSQGVQSTSGIDGEEDTRISLSTERSDASADGLQRRFGRSRGGQ